MSNDFKSHLYESDKSSGIVTLYKLKYSLDAFDPVMSKDNVDYHYNVHTKGYVKNAKANGDTFNTAGAILHNMWWEQLIPPNKNNAPTGDALKLIEAKYLNVENLIIQAKEKFMAIQGSGWLMITDKGNIITVHNHRVVENVIIVIDAWEHAWYPTYNTDKKAYFEQIWQCINWDVVNKRLNK